MKFRLIHARDKWNAVPAEWSRQYDNSADAHKQTITAALLALAPEDRNGDVMAAIIGNTSWTDHKCDLCDQHKDTLCRLGEEPDYGARWIDVCVSCLRGIISVFEKSS